MDPRIPRQSRRPAPALVLEEVTRRLPVYLRELQKFDHIDAAFAGLAFGKKRVREPKALAHVSLAETSVLSSLDQPANDRVVSSLEWDGSRFARSTALGRSNRTHPSSVGTVCQIP